MQSIADSLDYVNVTPNVHHGGEGIDQSSHQNPKTFRSPDESYNPESSEYSENGGVHGLNSAWE